MVSTGDAAMYHVSGSSHSPFQPVRATQVLAQQMTSPLYCCQNSSNIKWEGPLTGHNDAPAVLNILSTHP